MTYLKSSKRTLTPKQTPPPLGKHPDNIMPYETFSGRYRIGAEKINLGSSSTTTVVTSQEGKIIQTPTCDNFKGSSAIQVLE